MPAYCFTSDSGQTIERFYRMGDAPESVSEVGVVYRRDYAAEQGQISAVVKEQTHGFPKVSNTARQWEGADAGFSHTSDGKVVLRSMTEQREFCRRYGYTREYD